jgi:hypothetical protein
MNHHFLSKQAGLTAACTQDQEQQTQRRDSKFYGFHDEIPPFSKANRLDGPYSLGRNPRLRITHMIPANTINEKLMI